MKRIFRFLAQQPGMELGFFKGVLADNLLEATSTSELFQMVSEKLKGGFDMIKGGPSPL